MFNNYMNTLLNITIQFSATGLECSNTCLTEKGQIRPKIMIKIIVCR